MSDPSRPSTRVCSLLPDLGLVHSDRCMWSSASGQRLYPIILFSGFLLGVVPPQSSSFAVWADEGGLSKTSKYPLTKLHSPPEFWTERCQMGVPGDLWKVLVLWGLLEHWPFCSSQGRHTLPVLWIMPFTDDPGCGNITEATLPAVHLAQQHLRKQPAPLCNYELEIHLVNSQVILNSISSAFALSFVVNSDLYVKKQMMCLCRLQPTTFFTAPWVEFKKVHAIVHRCMSMYLQCNPLHFQCKLLAFSQCSMCYTKFNIQ